MCYCLSNDELIIIAQHVNSPLRDHTHKASVSLNCALRSGLVWYFHSIDLSISRDFLFVFPYCTSSLFHCIVVTVFVCTWCSYIRQSLQNDELSPIYPQISVLSLCVLPVTRTHTHMLVQHITVWSLSLLFSYPSYHVVSPLLRCCAPPTSSVRPTRLRLLFNCPKHRLSHCSTSVALLLLPNTLFFLSLLQLSIVVRFKWEHTSHVSARAMDRVAKRMIY